MSYFQFSVKRDDLLKLVDTIVSFGNIMAAPPIEIHQLGGLRILGFASSSSSSSGGERYSDPYPELETYEWHGGETPVYPDDFPGTSPTASDVAWVDDGYFPDFAGVLSSYDRTTGIASAQPMKLNRETLAWENDGSPVNVLMKEPTNDVSGTLPVMIQKDSVSSTPYVFSRYRQERGEFASESISSNHVGTKTEL